MFKVKLLQIGLLFVLLVVGFTTTMNAQESGYVGNRGLGHEPNGKESQVNDAFRHMNFELIAKNFDENVEISFPNKEGSFSKIQAKFVLKEFFTDYPLTKFEHSYIGVVSSKQSRYTIGEYSSDKGNFDVRVNYKSKQGFYVIDRITIVRK